MGILVEDRELDNLYGEWEETLPIHELSWEIYVARVQLKNDIAGIEEVMEMMETEPGRDLHLALCYKLMAMRKGAGL